MNNTQQTIPTVSVILPNYNYENYLEFRISSILGQTFQDFELIILDDASTDGSRDIIEKYRSNSHVTQIIYNTKNSGKPCIQWEKGWKAARGKYIWIAETDDLAERDFLEKAVGALEAEKGSVLFFCGSLQNSPDGQFNRDRYDRWAQPKFRRKQDENLYIFDGRFYIDHYLVWSNSIYNASGTVFRRDAIDESDWKYCCEFYGLGDWALWSRIAAKGKVLISPEKLNLFRRHHNSATRRFSKNFRNLVERMRIVKENMSGLKEKKRLIVISRLRKISMHSAHSCKDRKTIDARMAEIYGEDICRKSIYAGIANSMLILTPWHVCQSNDHKIRP